jgi:hypothetical protein
LEKTKSLNAFKKFTRKAGTFTPAFLLSRKRF